MEWIFIAALFFVPAIFRAITNNSGDFSSNSSFAKNNYFGPAALKFINESPGNIYVKRIMLRGKILNSGKANVAFSIGVMDVTDKINMPMISFIESLQCPESTFFGLTDVLGEVTSDSSFVDWIQLGVICPDLMQPPKSGNRKISIILTMYDANNPPHLISGIPSESPGGKIFLHKTIDFYHDYKQKGYEEESLHREESQIISLKIAVAVAMADGSLADKEGKVLKDWIIKQISPYKTERKKDLKKLFNATLKEAFHAAEENNLTLSELVERLSEIGEEKNKYDAIELSLDVMTADGTADAAEMDIIRNVAEGLNLDMKQIEDMREKVTLSLSSKLSNDDGLEALVGLDSSWTKEKKRTYLRQEFQKWSNRLNSLDDSDEKNNAQSMLDSIGKLRKKYE